MGDGEVEKERRNQVLVLFETIGNCLYAEIARRVATEGCRKRKGF